MGYIPSMKFASGFEILEYCQSMADKFGFYDHCLFHTTVDSTVWDEQTGRWTVYTDRGDAMKARYVILANGILTSPKLARIDGMASFEGESFHTSRWDYNIDLEGKRVGIIGTGATAVQVIPEIAKVVGELYVFQRTPSSIDVRDQRATDPEEIAEWSKEPGWARARRKRFSRISSGRTAIKANDDYLAGRVADFKERKQHERKLSPTELVQKQLNTNFRIMEQIRARVDAIVEDPKTAEAAEAVLPLRLQATDVPRRVPAHVQPSACAPRGHRTDGSAGDQRARRRARGHRVPPRRAHLRHRFPVDGNFDVQHDRGPRGPRTARRLSEKWQTQGTRTFLGLHSHGFPNLFIVSGPQGGGGSFNFTDAIDTHGDYIIWMLTEMRDKALNVVDITEDSEVSYAEHCRVADITTAPLRDCLSYYNGHGDAQPGSLAYYGGGYWHKFRIAAQESLDPYLFEFKSERVAQPAG